MAGAQPRADLHAFTGVAQLKLRRSVKPFLSFANLHAFTGVAQLKSREAELGAFPLANLHAFTGVAQLKCIEAWQPRRLATYISTPSPAWPN